MATTAAVSTTTGLPRLKKMPATIASTSSASSPSTHHSQRRGAAGPVGGGAERSMRSSLSRSAEVFIGTGTGGGKK